MLQEKTADLGIAVLCSVTRGVEVESYELGAAVFTHCLNGIEISDIFRIVSLDDLKELLFDVGKNFLNAEFISNLLVTGEDCFNFFIIRFAGDPCLGNSDKKIGYLDVILGALARRRYDHDLTVFICEKDAADFLNLKCVGKR